jgi:hypothetical protein
VTDVTAHRPVPSKTTQFAVEASTDQQASAVQDSSEPVAEEEEEKKKKKSPDETHAGSKTETEKLQRMVEDLKKKISELQKQKAKLQDADRQQIKVAIAAQGLRKGINEAASILTNLLEKDAFRKTIFQEWQKRNTPNNNYGTNGELIEHLKEVFSMMKEDYWLMRWEINQLKKKLEVEKQERSEAIDAYRQKSEELYESRQLIKRVELENKTLKEQATRGRAIRAAREQAAREQAAREQAAREQAARDQAARDQAAREQAAREQAARDQAAREQAARDQAAHEREIREQAAQEQAAQDHIDLLGAILDTQQLRENIMVYQYNEALLQHEIMRVDNEQLVQALENRTNHHADEITLLICQMIEFNSMSEANDINARASRPRSSPQMRWTRNGWAPRIEYVVSFIPLTWFSIITCIH